MSRKALWAVAVLACVQGCMAQVPDIGECEANSIMKDFDISNFLGKWYVIKKFFSFYGLASSCETETFYLNETDVYIKHEETNSVNGLRSEDTFRASFYDDKGEGRFVVHVPIYGIPIALQVVVLDTDYEDYAVLHSCTEFYLFHINLAWIISRKRFPTSLDKAYQVAERNNLLADAFLPANQLLCPLHH